jgi:hypothetical protein
MHSAALVQTPGSNNAVNAVTGLSIWLVILCRRSMRLSGQAELPAEYAIIVV